jgi:amidase
MKPEAIWEVEESMKLNALDIYQASQLRTGWVKETNRLFTKYDFLVLPSAQLFPFDIRWTWPKEIAHQTMDTYHRWMEVVIGPTLAGLPVLAAPVGFHQGIPMGIQIIGKPQGDLELLQMGFAWEQVVPFHETRPALLRGL